MLGVMGSMQVTMETLRMREQCIPGAPSDFSSAWNEANYDIYTFIYSSSSNTYLIILLLEACTSPFYVLRHIIYLHSKN